MSSPCPTPDQLRSLFDGARPPQNARVMLSHLEGCNRCREALAELVPGAELPVEYAPDSFWSHVGAAAPPASGTAPNTLPEAPETDGSLFFTPETKSLRYLPRRVGTYDVLRVLGRGGMGMVVKALDGALNRFVAVKVLFPHQATDQSYRQRFAREARSAATIGSDHATNVYAVGEDGDAPYIVMEYVNGEDLETRLNRDGRLPVPAAVCVARQVAAGLVAAHAQGVVHRDIKPGNVLLEGARGGEIAAGGCAPVRVKITDFGIARAATGPAITAVQEAVGTPEYMAPEQINGDPLDHRSDLYSLGLLLYRMLTNRLPFTGRTAMSCFAQHLSKEPPPPREFAPDLPEWIDSLVMKLLRKDPAERVQTAAEVVRLLDEGAAKLMGPPAEPEAKRLAALRSYRVLDTDSEQAFDDLTFLASHICGTPIAIVSLVDEDRQWFKSKVGLSVSQTARNISFCQYTIRGTAPMIVGNATADERFADNPLVKLDPHIRFYAGVPLIDPEGCALGSLCVIDRVARGLSSEQIAALGALGRLVMVQLGLRREVMELRGEGVASASGGA